MPSTLLIPALVLFVVWCLLLLASPRTRQEQAVMSLVGLVLSPAILFFAAQTGTGAVQPIAVENLIFGASFFGVAAVIYEGLFGRFFVANKGPRFLKRTHSVLAWTARLILAAAIWSAVTVACLFVLGLSFLQAMLVSALFVGVYVIAERKDLLGDALASGACMAVLILLSQLIFAFALYRLPLGIGGLPLTLVPVAWAAIVGFAIGPLYEYVRRLKAVR